MPNDDYITDDYVAELLAKEASTQSLKYSDMGMSDPRVEKKPANMPKPNKRFLERIIQSTNNHNANLLASETAESRARLRTLEKADEREKRKQATPQDVRRRQLGDIKAILGDRGSQTNDQRKKSVQEDQLTSGRAGSRDESPSSSFRRRKRHDRSRSPSLSKTEHRRHDHDRSRKRDDKARYDSDEESHRRRRRHRSRSRSLEDHRKRRRGRSRSPSRDRNNEKPTPRGHREDREKSSRRGHGGHSRRSSSKSRREDRHAGRPLETLPQHRARGRPGRSLTPDSDPLDDIVGPAPAPAPAIRTRGRGFQSRSSGMDKRFEEDYDPNADVEIEEEAAAGLADWDSAVETFRDRKKWQQSQEQRLRAAGFKDDDINKWKKGGVLDEEDVRWSKAGEQREWDRGKGNDLKGIFSADDLV